MTTANSPVAKGTRRAQSPSRDESHVGGTHLDVVLTALIDSPDSKPGDRLPTERALAERYGVTRGAIRAALGRIEGRGRIVRVIGSGTYIAENAAFDEVHAAASIPSAPPARDASPQEIMEARALIEPLLPALVASRANAADLDRIRAAIEGAERATTQEEFEAWDGLFHQAIAEATHNVLLVDIYRMITAARDLAEWGELKRRNATAKRRAEREAEHKAIFEALQTRDAERARHALSKHLHAVSRNILG